MNINEKIVIREQKYCCEICDYNTSKHCDYKKHILTRKHEMLAIKSIKNVEGKRKNYVCEKCDYNTSNLYDFNKHNLTQKHIVNINNNLQQKKSQQNTCDTCNRVFNSYNSLWKHKNKYNCITHSSNLREDVHLTTNKETISSDLILEVIKQSKEIQNVLIEQNKELQAKLLEMAKSQTVVNNNTMNNNNFNLQVFLNETCKDAINIMDFVNSLQLQAEDFEATGKLGYVEGISRIIINGMKNIEIEKRPMHCTDVKRETVYIKDEDTWSKEDVDKNKFKKVIKTVAQMNLNQLPKWQEKNPAYVNINTPENENLIKYSLSALGSRTDEEEDKFVSKIMKNVMKEVVLSRK